MLGDDADGSVITLCSGVGTLVCVAVSVERVVVAGGRSVGNGGKPGGGRVGSVAVWNSSAS